MLAQPPSNPDTHKKLPKGKAMILPIQDPLEAMPTRRLRSVIGAQCDQRPETAGQKAPF